jgi:hypothetical protein
MGCKERTQLIVEALVAYRAGDTDTFWNKLQKVATSMGKDVKIVAAALLKGYPYPPRRKDQP